MARLFRYRLILIIFDFKLKNELLMTKNNIFSLWLSLVLVVKLWHNNRLFIPVIW